MCGIAGIAGTEARRPDLERMLEATAHRGPDGTGIFVSPQGRTLLGHRRLAIVDVTDAARQPMSTPEGRFTLVFNGEVYNFRALRDRLASRGVAVKSTGDTEVVLQWLALHGAAGLGDLQGMYALALFDRDERTLLLARDAFGIKPLYVSERPGRVAFSSEIRALLSAGVPGRMDPQALSDYLAYGVVLEPRTILAEVEMLAPGTWRTWSEDAQALARGRFDVPFPLPPDRLTTPEAVREAFLDAVRSHLVSDVPIGAFLSGGVDSSAIVAAMTRVPGFDVRTLTVSFPDAPAWDESKEAAAWAARCGTKHQDIPVTASDLLGLLESALPAQDQPTLDGVNTYIVSKAARQAGLTVALSGLGGDELFGGYASTRDVPKAIRLRRALGFLGPPLGRGLEKVGRPWSKTGAKRADLLTSEPTVGGLYAARRRTLSPAQVRRLWPEAPPLALPASLSDPRLGDLDPKDAVSRMETDFYMRNQLLRDSDVMGMACSLELRVPFLDLRFAREAWSSGAAWRDKKAHFVKALGGLVDPAIQARRKRGFTLPFEPWMRGPLRSRVEERIRSLPQPIDRAAAESLWRRFLADPEGVGWTRPWSLYVLAGYVERHGLSL